MILGIVGSGGGNVEGSKQGLECGDVSQKNWFNPKTSALFLES